MSVFEFKLTYVVFPYALPISLDTVSVSLVQKQEQNLVPKSGK